MAKRMSIATLKRWWKNTRTQSYRAVSGWLRSVLRPLLRAVQRPQNSRSGFVLPTAALLLLVVSLVIAAVLLRTINRTEQVIGIREEKVIYNAATPAIDRAKAKIEYMFTEDTRLPAGVPSEERLYDMMLNKASAGAVLNPNPYLIPEEEPIKINGQESPAWAYRVDSDGNGEDDLTVAYSITWKFPSELTDLEKTDASDIRARARNFEVRNGPMSGDPNSQCRDIRSDELPPIESGFLTDPASTAILRKNFQIDAFVISDKENGTVAALEMQQDRQANRGNKWGAWFRSDLELFPGPYFNWNGAIRTDGSLFVGRDPDRMPPRLNAYLVSAPASCIYQAGKDNSIISLGKPPSNKKYEGQVVSALINIDAFQGTSAFHIQQDEGAPTTDLAATRIDPDTDSVNVAGSPTALAVNPLLLFTEDRSEFRGFRDSSQVKDAAWDGKGGRVANEAIEKPVVDDFYRADDRYGPKPAYGTSAQDTLVKLGKRIGEPISGEPRFTTMNPVASGTSDDATDLGLDGYWERRAVREGMRVITGQRLELGNDPLPAPVDYVKEALTIPVTNFNNASRVHETVQRRALRDNPAAVQATAIYHHAANGELPVAAVATTVHPGTAETLKRSAIFETPFTFATLPGLFGGTFGNDPNEFAVDFFTGRGTNGWEFEVPTAFFTNAEVSKALQNLSHFAGDPDGAFPPTQEAGRIHPYPELTKWGNFSELRRSLDDPTSPESLADRTNKHTAALTLGMLAYNLNYLDAYDYNNNINKQLLVAANGLDAALQKALTDPRPRVPPAIAGTAAQGLPLGATPEDYIEAVGNLTAGAGLTLPDIKKNEQVARLLFLKEQTLRDRIYGFKASPLDPGKFEYTVTQLVAGDNFVFGGLKYDKAAAAVKPTQPVTPPTGIPTPIATSKTYFNCNFGPIADGGNNYFGFGAPADKPAEQRFLRLATAICGINEDTSGDGILSNPVANRTEDLNRNKMLDSVKYPSLYYLFPKVAHTLLGNWTAAQIAVPGIDGADRYLKDAYVQSTSGAYSYQPVLVPQMVLNPKPIANWVLPHEPINPVSACRNNAAAGAPNPNCSQYNVVYDGKNSLYHRVAIEDTGLFNGREMMNVRVLNLDLELLKDQRTPGGDTWIAGGNDKDSEAGGIVFAFREDAVREDAIARPAGTSWNSCKTVTSITAPGCQTKVLSQQDPPVNSANGISPKPVDFYADPDRRPYGFRLINGSDLSHPKQGGVVNYGLTFISDNSAYIQGDFNCHKSPGGNCDRPIEEFRQTISDKNPADANYVTEFYSRTRPQYKVFANPTSDSWRTSELLVDALTILSDNFCDGSIEDGIITVADGINPGGQLKNRLGNAAGVGRAATASPTLQSIYGCNNASVNYTSYLNQNRPNDPGTPFNGWRRENPADPASPIQISPNGNPVLAAGGDYIGNYFRFTDGNASGNLKLKPLNKASSQRVNAVIISGIVPFRAYQSSGGLHNFPRFLEDWDGVPLNISGSLLQLNFSTAATAPWDPDAWEPTGATVPKDQYGYYLAPQRLWGYDVALQLVSAGPISTRLINIGKSRSEYYRELPLDDPYINNLRCANYKGNPIDPRAQANGDCA